MNDFSVHRIIGRGGFGEVYGCRKADTGKMYAMKCLDKKRIKMKQGETLALNERIMLSLVSTGVSFVLHSTHTHARRESSAPSHPRASDSVRPPASPFIIPGAAPHYCCSRCLLSNFNYIRNQSSVCTSEWVRLMMQRERERESGKAQGGRHVFTHELWGVRFHYRNLYEFDLKRPNSKESGFHPGKLTRWRKLT